MPRYRLPAQVAGANDPGCQSDQADPVTANNSPTRDLETFWVCTQAPVYHNRVRVARPETREMSRPDIGPR